MKDKDLQELETRIDRILEHEHSRSLCGRELLIVFGHWSKRLQGEAKRRTAKEIDKMIGKEEVLPDFHAMPYLWSERNARNYFRKELREKLKSYLINKK